MAEMGATCASGISGISGISGVSGVSGMAVDATTNAAMSVAAANVVSVVEEKKVRANEDTEDFRSQIVPLGRVVNENFARVMDTLPVDGDATVVAARAILTTLHLLWHTPNKKWRDVRNKVRLGFIKETKTCGNTSVSMGCAKRYFDIYPEQTLVGFINCGGGGNKYQLYTRLDGKTISVDYEYKPKAGSSPGRATVGGFNPGKDALSDTENDGALVAEIATFCTEVRKRFGKPCSVRAFVTGKFRNHWEQQTPGVQTEMNEWCVRHFRTVGVTPAFRNSYCLRQDDEGDLEAIGTTDMYRNLAANGLIGADVGVVGICGIGQSSVQIVNQSHDEAENKRANYTPGMSKPDLLANMPYTTVPILQSQLDDIIRWVEACPCPVIALKSGCLLFFGFPAGKASLDAALYARKPPPPPKVIRTDIENLIMGFAVSTSTMLNKLQALLESALPEDDTPSDPATLVVAQPVMSQPVISQPVMIHSGSRGVAPA